MARAAGQADAPSLEKCVEPNEAHFLLLAARGLVEELDLSGTAQHGHSTVTARAQHGHSTVTARSQHGHSTGTARAQNGHSTVCQHGHSTVTARTGGAHAFDI